MGCGAPTKFKVEIFDNSDSASTTEVSAAKRPLATSNGSTAPQGEHQVGEVESGPETESQPEPVIRPTPSPTPLLATVSSGELKAVNQLGGGSSDTLEASRRSSERRDSRTKRTSQASVSFEEGVGSGSLSPSGPSPTHSPKTPARGSLLEVNRPRPILEAAQEVGDTVAVTASSHREAAMLAWTGQGGPSAQTFQYIATKTATKDPRTVVVLLQCHVYRCLYIHAFKVRLEETGQYQVTLLEKGEETRGNGFFSGMTFSQTGYRFLWPFNQQEESDDEAEGEAADAEGDPN